jgi:hypothetical protein
LGAGNAGSERVDMKYSSMSPDRCVSSTQERATGVDGTRAVAKSDAHPGGVR